ncbi:cupredoxin domain-containing protein [Thalassotalea mangrovi]|uniref:Cupredoxin domain-containing protein n=1 Tax=Thalassotalea mangrovi TaxID=2572245 RepID=A0A4U1BA84_9GAMM|nr:cupredoxin domain-containing protein [Thalassotalea mangrovi]TKB47436.1 cupredoxin domain-containing protein [Thalassotalea mangrovi]
MIMVNLLGLALIALIVWWFWLYQRHTYMSPTTEVTIDLADGVYHPDVIQVKANSTVKLKFLRTDPSPCSEILQIPSLNYSQQLNLDQITEVTIEDIPRGDHPFHCQMKMYNGLLQAV